MVEEDIKRYSEVENKKLGKVKVEKGIRIRFLENEK
jgi:hypothetical protein